MTGVPCPLSLRQSVRAQQLPALAVGCSQCEAQPSQPCKGPSGRKLTNQHAARFEKAGLKPQLVTGPDLREGS
jgi:hypothetical protein